MVQPSLFRNLVGFSVINDERKFIHDISNTISIALGNLRLIVKRWEESPNEPPSPDLLVRMEKVMNSFEKITELVSERRGVLSKNTSNI